MGTRFGRFCMLLKGPCKTQHVYSRRFKSSWSSRVWKHKSIGITGITGDHSPVSFCQLVICLRRRLIRLQELHTRSSFVESCE